MQQILTQKSKIIEQLTTAAKTNKGMEALILRVTKPSFFTDGPLTKERIASFVDRAVSVSNPKFNDHVQATGLEYICAGLISHVAKTMHFNDLQEYLQAYHEIKNILKPLLPEVKQGYPTYKTLKESIAN